MNFRDSDSKFEILESEILNSIQWIPLDQFGIQILDAKFGNKTG